MSLHAPYRRGCQRCVNFRTATVYIDREPLCPKHAKKAMAQPKDIKIEPAPSRRTALSVVLALVMLIGATAAALEPTNGAREGESIEARIERLRGEIEERQVALRLSIAEQRVNARRRP